MSLRALVALLALLAAAGSALYWLGRSPAPATAPAIDEPLVPAFTQERVRTMTIDCDGRHVVLARDASGAWRVEAPFRAVADPRRVQDLLAALQDARIRRSIAERGQEAGFGLAPATCAAVVSGEPGAALGTVRLGRTSPVGTERYAATATGKIVLTDGSLYGALAVDPERFRERRLIPVDPEAITRIVLDRPDGRVALAGNAEGWRIEAPFNDAASSDAARRLARAITSIEVDEAAGSPRPIASRSDRRLAIEVGAGAGAPVRAFVATAGTGGKRLAWRGAGELFGLVGDTALSELLRPADTYRDLRVVTFSSPDARRLEIARGGETLRVDRPAEGSAWTGQDAKGAFTPDAGSVLGVLDRLRILTAAGVERGGPATPPSGTLSVGGAHGDLARLTWGPLPPAKGSSEEAVWITTPSRPGVVFRVPAVAFGPIPKDRAAFVR